MIIDFSLAKNNELTFSVDGKYYHSKYNPSAEAEKWISQIQCNYNPKVVIVLGAGLPYFLNLLTQKFCNSKILLVQYNDEIYNKVNSNFNKNFTNDIFQICTNQFSSAQNFSEYLFNNFGEELSNQILFLSWKTSENIFVNEYNFALNAIQLYINKSKDLIATRRFFSKKWISNIIRFFNFTQNFYKIEKVNSDILIIASGTSLTNSLEKIKKHKDNFFIISVSSATKVLLHNKIIPDLILTTDGGYWAKKHLQFLENENYDIPIMCTAESALPFNLLKKNKIIPLEYNDFTNKYFFSKTNLHTMKVNRNGTVSGTALEVAKQLTDKNIFYIGLDLANTTGYQHAQPNILEINDSLQDNFLNTKENRICIRNINSSALTTYKNWFENLSKSYTSNVKRIFNFETKNDLGNIKSTNWNKINFTKKLNTANIIPQKNYQKINIQKIILEIIENINDSEWLSNLSLGNILNYKKFNDKIFLQNAIAESKDFFYTQLQKLEKQK